MAHPSYTPLRGDAAGLEENGYGEKPLRRGEDALIEAGGDEYGPRIGEVTGEDAPAKFGMGS